ncbi:MAG TPA: PEP-utilizing enzyme, partial [Acidimicrobiales bacterium]|nr:PEP-utilizing enzyme [Acidimicrobiales bacterium]
SGSWALDPVHFPRPVTRYWTEMHPEPFRRGTNEFARYFGMLIDGLEMTYVHGFGYNRILPAPDAEVPQRFQRAEEVFANRLWRDQLREWDEVRKPGSVATHREIQAVDPDALSDADLVAYILRCRDHHAAMITQHMRFTGAAMLPVGDFLAHVGMWTGISHAELLGLMRGAAPVSAGGSEELERFISAIRADPKAVELVQSEGEPTQVLAELRSLDGEAGAAVNGYLDLIGYRLLDGFDISEPSAMELPDALLRAIRAAVSGSADGAAETDLADRISDVRNQVPDEHKSEFDELLGEARLMYRLRDERGVYSDIWASGLMRRATLAGGRRLASKGVIDDPILLIDASVDEMRALLEGSSGPTASELAERRNFRTSHSAKDAPPFLGPPPPPPPDPSGLPPAVARLMHATGIAIGSVFGGAELEHGENLVRGLAASRGTYEGPARKISGPSEFGRIMQGDVLVTPATTEAFNILLPLLGAIVTDSGGLLSHSAIVAREYGIPGVVGTGDATELIADGARVRVDGDVGEVTVLT